MSDTTKWQNNTYVLLSDLHDDHEIALIENSLRDSEFYVRDMHFDCKHNENCLGVLFICAGAWLPSILKTKLTRTQALKLAGVKND